MNRLRMKWKSQEKPQQRRPDHREQPPAWISDAQLDLLANRYQANHICYLLDITFDAYLLAPKGWDRIAKHLHNGGGCRMEAGQLVMNDKPRAGICGWCERWWSARSGGLNEGDLCPECARNILMKTGEARHA